MKATRMNTKSDFSCRLYDEFQRVGLPMHSPTQIARILNRRALHARVTPQAVRKWLYHGVFPSQDKLINLADWLGVSVQWLRFGIGDKEDAHSMIVRETDQEVYEALHLSQLMKELSQLPEKHIEKIHDMIQTLKEEAQYLSQNLISTEKDPEVTY
jgi:transcriptional regulator with XRE-family HTH domain